MLLGGVAVARIIGIGLDDRGVGQVTLNKFANPRTRDDIGTVFLTRMQLDAHLARHSARNTLIHATQALGGKVAREVHDRFRSIALAYGDVDIAVRCRCDLFVLHAAPP